MATSSPRRDAEIHVVENLNDVGGQGKGFRDVSGLKQKRGRIRSRVHGYSYRNALRGGSLAGL